jgi:hypothetical protein
MADLIGTNADQQPKTEGKVFIIFVFTFNKEFAKRNANMVYVKRFRNFSLHKACLEVELRFLRSCQWAYSTEEPHQDANKNIRALVVATRPRP